jgi:hypothetical protein
MTRTILIEADMWREQTTHYFFLSTYTQDLGQSIVLISGGFGFQVVAVRRTRLHYALEIYGQGS